MNIAVLIGVSNYKVLPALPACARDVEEVRQLLAATKKYDEIFCISTNTDAAPLKDALRTSFGQYRTSRSIQEALVYFSGHGVYQNDVLLCCSDFDLNRPASTSVSNVELDDLLRSVGPDVAVKILDAYQSGSQYIKDTGVGFEKSLRESRLKSFICMASSKIDQSSFATADCSLFTSRFVDAALSKTKGPILYRDIQAALADSFVTTPDQTPFFVIQGSGLEAFAQMTPEMEALEARRQSSQAIVEPENTLAAAIDEQVQSLDSLYVSAEAASNAIKQAREKLEGATLSIPIVARFYEKGVTFDGKLTKLPSGQEVARFAEEQGWENKYFLRVVRESYQFQAPPNALYPASGAIVPGAIASGGTYWGGRGIWAGGVADIGYSVRTIEKPDHLETTEALPFEVARATFKPKAHPSLRSFILYIGLAHSLTELLVLSASTRLVEVGWTDRSVDISQLRWHSRVCKWTDVVARPDLVWEEPLGLAQTDIQIYLESLVPKKDDAPTQTLNAK
jgi:hypothetical protein